MLTIVTYWWGFAYDYTDVVKLFRGVARHLRQPHRMLVITDRTVIEDGRERPVTNLPSFQIPREDRYLLKHDGCFARLRMFDPSWQAHIGVEDRLVCMDLDSVVTGPLDPLFDRPEPFCILQGANSANPCPYNGSLWMLRRGYRPDVWSDFTLAAAQAKPHYQFPDDQSWFADMMPNAAGWQAGSSSGLYAFQKPGWPKNSTALPSDARLVVFPGWRSPQKFTHLPWVREHWQ